MGRKPIKTPVTHLTDKREVAFVMAFTGEAKGNASKAAELVGYSSEFSRNAAYRLMRTPRIRKAIELSNRELWLSGVGDRRERQEILTEIMRDPNAGKTARIRAIEVLARMQGDFIGKGGDSETQRTVLLYPVMVQEGVDTRTLLLPTGHAFDSVDIPPDVDVEEGGNGDAATETIEAEFEDEESSE